MCLSLMVCHVVTSRHVWTCLADVVPREPGGVRGSGALCV